MKRCQLLVLFAVGLFLIGCSKSNDSPNLPEINAAGVKQDRPLTDSDFQFKLSISKAASADITVDYATQDGNAMAGTDYVATSGTATIKAGSLSALINVSVKGDSLRQNDQYFSLNLSNPKNGTLSVPQVLGTIINSRGLKLIVDDTGYSTPLSYPNYSLVWSDEFNGQAIKSTNWTFEIGNSGWGNNELENYTERIENAFVSHGNLIIEARAEVFGGSNYTSARMITRAKKSFKYGRIDIRAKLPTGQGIWPALWMLGSNIGTVGWPACGEIDIMELIGKSPNKVYGTLHWGASVASHQSSGNNYTLSSGIFNDQFHVFSMVWDANQIQLFVDDNPAYFTKNINDNALPFNNDFFFIFNVAVGGDWPGSPDGTTQFPQRMIVDYVRVFQ